MSNLIIGIKMEELKRDARILAYVNCLLPVVFLSIGILSLGGFVSNNLLEGLKNHVVFMSLIELVMFPFYFYFWFKFLGSLKRNYEGNANIMPAVIIAKTVLVLKILFMFIGLIASMVIFSKHSFTNLNVQTGYWGLYPDGTTGYIFTSIRLIVIILAAIMYFLLSESTESKSSMRYIALALAVITIVSGSANLQSEAWGWNILQYVGFVLEFVFLYRISQGYEFIGNKKEE